MTMKESKQQKLTKKQKRLPPPKTHPQNTP